MYMYSTCDVTYFGIIDKYCKVWSSCVWSYLRDFGLAGNTMISRPLSSLPPWKEENKYKEDYKKKRGEGRGGGKGEKGERGRESEGGK